MYPARWIALLALAMALTVGPSGCSSPPCTNVLLITVDTLRADRIGCYGWVPARTPAMDRLAADGVRCSDAAATAPITLPSHSSILTGLFPPAHGVRDNGAYALGDDALTLAERLRSAGYATGAFVSALVLNRRYGLMQGFDVYDDDMWAEDEPKLFMIRDRPALKTAAHAVTWLEERMRRGETAPFFLWVHFFDPHQPYQPPLVERLRSPTLYDAEIAFADRGVARLLGHLEEQGQLDRTLVVLTADHGESLGEHGEKTHAIFVYDATVRVPLILRFPDRLPRGAVFDGPVRSVDIVPTVLALLGLPGGETTQGTDLRAAFTGHPAPALPQYSESLTAELGFGMAPLFSVQSRGYKWIRAPRPEIYDLANDPHELTNLYPAMAETGEQLDRQLEAVLEDSAAHAVASPRNPLDSETESMLQALGYLTPRNNRQAMAGLDPKDGIGYYTRLEDARHAAQRNDWDQAELLLRGILAELPKHLSARQVLGLVLYRTGQVDQAREEYLRVLVQDPGQFRTWCMLGLIAMTQGDLDEAERCERRALEIAPGFVEAIADLGLIAALRDDQAGAEEWYRRAIAADPTYPRVHRRLADLYFERGEYKLALDGYRRTLQVTPSDLAALLQAGASARRCGDPESAAGYLRRAAELRPDSWLPLYNLACLEAVAGGAEEAIDLLEQAFDHGFGSAGQLDEDPDLDSLRRAPAFIALRNRLSAAPSGG